MREHFRQGYSSLFDSDIDSAYRASLALSIVLGLVNMSGYVLITSYLAITEVPIIIATIDEGVKKAKAENKKKEKDKAREGFRDPGAWNAWFVTLVFNIFFIIMLYLNYPDSETRGTVNSVLILGINLPWTLVCVRNYLVVPDHMAARIYCIVFDCILKAGKRYSCELSR